MDFGNRDLQDILKDDLTTSMLDGQIARRDTIRVILGEMSRERDKRLDNLRIINIIKKLIKDEKESHNDAVFLAICSDYIPIEVSEEVIESWIRENIDLSQYKNKMQAMGPVMGFFKGRVDGNVVKTIIGRL
jgi:uncharacterized protein YqeY